MAELALMHRHEPCSTSLANKLVPTIMLVPVILIDNNDDDIKINRGIVHQCTEYCGMCSS